VLRREIAEAVRQGLEDGKSRAEIARGAGVSPSTVTRYARILGFPDAVQRPSKTDWKAVQAYYDEGRTIEECRQEFGFTFGAWDKAVCRGDLVARSRSNGELSGSTRDQVQQLSAAGFSQSAIARELGLSKSTVSFHVRRLGKKADPRFARRYTWSEVQAAIDDEGLSMTRCCERFGFCAETWSSAVRAGKIVPRPALIPLEKLLVKGRSGTNRSHLKLRLIRAGLKEDRCEICGISDWRGRPLVMELHHRNGDGSDNRLENLQLLCGNCHSQTDNWGGRAKSRKMLLEALKPPA
jgi:DNA-binding CsgD family transcriptional regulator